MMKYVTLFVSYMFGKYNSSVQGASEFLTAPLLLKIRRMTFLISIAMASALGMAIALSKGFDEMGLLWEEGSDLRWSGILVSSSVAFAGFAVVFGLTFVRRGWLSSAALSAATKANRTSPIEEAVTLLILDFVKEREWNREHKKSPESEPKVNHQSQQKIWKKEGPRLSDEELQHQLETFV